MNKERLEIANKFIEALPPEKFNFGEVGHCGSVACYCGWLPAIFPEFFGNEHIYSLKGREGYSYDVVAAHIFDIPQRHAEFLFTPSTRLEKLATLQSDATAQQVVDRVRQYMKIYGPENPVCDL